jgi:hypothetical protein
VTGNTFTYATAAPILTVTANSVAVDYGTAAALTYSVSGLIGSDTVATVLTGSPVLSSISTTPGTYGINQGSLAALNAYGYTVNFISGTYTINAPVVTTTIANEVQASVTSTINNALTVANNALESSTNLNSSASNTNVIGNQMETSGQASIEPENQTINSSQQSSTRSSQQESKSESMGPGAGSASVSTTEDQSKSKSSKADSKSDKESPQNNKSVPNKKQKQIPVCT